MNNTSWIPPAGFDRLPAEARGLVARLCMQKIPHEGPWFVQTYRNTEPVGEPVASSYPGPRSMASAIYALLTTEDFSALHRLRSDETWHFYKGDTVELFTLDADGCAGQVMLGTDVAAGQHPQYTVPRHTWMAARPAAGSADAYSLIGNTLAPGFDEDDYEPGIRQHLVAAYPEHRERIIAFTRS